MMEVRFHAQKGRGALDAAQILAAAFRFSGKDASWFIPLEWEFAVNFEAATARADETSTGKKQTALVVFYPPLLQIPDIWMGFENPDIVVINTRDSHEAMEYCDGMKIAAIDATGIAKRIGPCYGIPSLVAPMIGALAAAGKIVLGFHIADALKKSAASLRILDKDCVKLVKALEMAYDSVRIFGGKKSETGRTDRKETGVSAPEAVVLG